MACVFDLNLSITPSSNNAGSRETYCCCCHDVFEALEELGDVVVDAVCSCISITHRFEKYKGKAYCVTLWLSVETPFCLIELKQLFVSILLDRLSEQIRSVGSIWRRVRRWLRFAFYDVWSLDKTIDSLDHCIHDGRVQDVLESLGILVIESSKQS